RQNFGLVIGLRYRDRMESLLLSLVRDGAKVGYNTGGLGWGITVELPMPPVGQHEVLKNLTVLNLWRRPVATPRLEMWVGEAAQSRAGEFLERNRKHLDRPLAAVHPGAGKPAKQWGGGHFAALCDRLFDKGFEVLLLGGPGDLALGEEIVKQAKNQILPRLGTLSVPDMSALI